MRLSFQTADSEGLRQLTRLIGALLHEPDKRARQIAISHLANRQQAQSEWQILAGADRASAVKRARTLQTYDLDEVAAFIDRSNRGVVLTTVHGGDYLLALLRVHLALKTRRKILVVRKKAPSALETAVFDLIGNGTPVEVVRHGEQRAIRLVKALRRGHLVVALYDLPASFGPTLEVNLLEQPMHLVRGPAELAVLGQADLIPLIAWRDRQAPALACLPPIREQTVAPACRQLATIATNYILNYPAQWQHWVHVPEMINPGGSCA